MALYNVVSDHDLLQGGTKPLPEPMQTYHRWGPPQFPLQWRHNERDGVSTHRRLDCLLKRFFRSRSKNTPKLCVSGLCEGNPRVAVKVDSPQIVPETRKMLQFDDVMNEEWESLKSAANHHDVITWKHFSRCWPFVWGIRRSPVNSPHKGQWRGALMFSLICPWIKGSVNNREAGDLRRHRAHYDVIVMNEIY